MAVAVVQNLNPIMWPKLAFGEPISHAMETNLLMVSNAIMMIAAVYYNLQWVKSVQTAKAKRQKKKNK